MSMDSRESDSKSESLMESVEVDVIPETDSDEQEEALLEDEDGVLTVDDELVDAPVFVEDHHEFLIGVLLLNGQVQVL